MLFSYQSFFSSLVGVQNFPFLTTWPKKRASPKHYKIGFQQSIFWKTDVRRETAIFRPKKPKPEFQLSFLPILFFSTRKHTNIGWNPYFLRFRKHKTFFPKLNLKQRNLEIKKNNLCALFFLKMAISRKLADNWTQKNTHTHKMITKQKMTRDHSKYRSKITLAQIMTYTWPR